MTQSGRPTERGGADQPAPSADPSGDLSGPSGDSSAEPLTQRLRPPVSWWVVSAVFVASAWVAVGFYLGALAGVLAALSVTALVSLFLIGSALRIRLDHDGFAAADNRIEWRWVTDVIVHDRESTRARLGPGADPRAHLITRPWATESIELVLDDPADPHPYWLVSAADARALQVTARRWLSTD